jgi:hypothetical protein
LTALGDRLSKSTGGTVQGAVTFKGNFTVETGGNFDGEQRMANTNYCSTMYDIASGVGCSLKNTRALDN